MPEYRCSMVLDTVEMDGVKEPIYCGKPARRKVMVNPDYDAGHFLPGCCEDCVNALRGDLTEDEIERLYPVWAEALPWYPGTTSWSRIKALR